MSFSQKNIVFLSFLFFSYFDSSKRGGRTIELILCMNKEKMNNLHEIYPFTQYVRTGNFDHVQ